MLNPKIRVVLTVVLVLMAEAAAIVAVGFATYGQPHDQRSSTIFRLLGFEAGLVLATLFFSLFIKKDSYWVLYMMLACAVASVATYQFGKIYG